MDLPDLVFDAEHKNVLAVIVGSFTAVMPQRIAGDVPRLLCVVRRVSV